MKPIKSLFLVLFLLVFAMPQAFARAGGGASVGKSAPSPSVSRSSFASAPTAPRYAPAAAPAPSVNRSAPPPTVINNNSGGGGGGFASSFIGGMAGSVIGNAISHPTPAPVVVAGGGYAAPAAAVAPAPSVAVPYTASAAPVYVESRSNSNAWLVFFAMLLVFGAVAAAIYFFFRAERDTPMAGNEETRFGEPPAPAFDPLEFFYAVQQASMDDNREALRKLCTPGMAIALSDAPEAGRVATQTLKAVQWHYVDDNLIEFRSTDTKTDTGRAVERWVFTDENKLDGIQVL